MSGSRSSSQSGWGTKARRQWALNDLKAKAEPAKVEEQVLKKYVGRYAEAGIVLDPENKEYEAMDYSRDCRKQRLSRIEENN